MHQNAVGIGRVNTALRKHLNGDGGMDCLLSFSGQTALAGIGRQRRNAKRAFADDFDPGPDKAVQQFPPALDRRQRPSHLQGQRTIKAANGQAQPIEKVTCVFRQGCDHIAAGGVPLGVGVVLSKPANDNLAQFGPGPASPGHPHDERMHELGMTLGACGESDLSPQIRITARRPNNFVRLIFGEIRNFDDGLGVKAELCQSLLRRAAIGRDNRQTIPTLQSVRASNEDGSRLAIFQLIEVIENQAVEVKRANASEREAQAVDGIPCVRIS